MSKLKPVSRRDLISRLKLLGFTGPYSGSDHQFMISGDVFIRLPNPHGDDIGIDLLQRILKQADISRDEWLKTK